MQCYSIYLEHHFQKCGQNSIIKYSLKKEFHMQVNLKNIGLKVITCLYVEEFLVAFNISKHVVDLQESALKFKVF